MGEFNPALFIANFKVPVSLWGMLGEISPIRDGFRCANRIVTAELPASKIHLLPSQWVGVFNPALTIPDQKSPRVKLGKNSQNPGTLKSAMKSAGLNAPAYWNGIRWIFDAFNNAVTIVFAQQEPSEIGGNCLTIAMVCKPSRSLAKSRMFHDVCGLPIGAPK